MVSLGGHSALDPLLPIPNRYVKRSCADDSVYTHVKVGYCQALYVKAPYGNKGLFFLNYNMILLFEL